MTRARLIELFKKDLLTRFSDIVIESELLDHKKTIRVFQLELIRFLKEYEMESMQ